MLVASSYQCARTKRQRSLRAAGLAKRALLGRALWLVILATAPSFFWGQAAAGADDLRPSSAGEPPYHDFDRGIGSQFTPIDRQRSAGRTVAGVLDELEREVFNIAIGVADAKNLPQIEAAANDAGWRASTPRDQDRARLLLRRVDRLASRSPSGEPGGVRTVAALQDAAGSLTLGGPVRLSQYFEPSAPPVPFAPPYGSAPGTSPFAPPIVPVIPADPPPPPRHYISLDALGWFVQQDHLPPLVTTSPLGTPQAQAGVLGLPTTSILFGDQGVNGGMRPGGRVQGGVWLDPLQTFAVEGHYYALATTATTYDVASSFRPGSPNAQILARPFFNDAPGVNQPQAVLTAFPNFVLGPFMGTIDGSIQVREASNLQSAGAGGRFALTEYTKALQVSVLAAYRYFNLNESLTIIATSTPGSNPFPFPLPQGRIESFDYFSTKNSFNGGELGIAAELWRRSWWFSGDTRLAMGGMHQSLAIDGRTSAISGGYVASYPGGLWAQPTNIGSYSSDRFAVIPQIDLKLGYQVLSGMRLTFGYNFTYVSNVVRPGGQVDTTVNTTQIAGLPVIGPHRPQVNFDTTGIWLQGITGGFDLRF